MEYARDSSQLTASDVGERFCTWIAAAVVCQGQVHTRNILRVFKFELTCSVSLSTLVKDLHRILMIGAFEMRLGSQHLPTFH